MMYRIIYLKVFLMLALLSLSLFAFAQEKKDDMSLLQGKWVLKDIVVRDNDNIINIDTDSIGFEVCSQIEFNKKEITVIYKKNTEKGEYTLEGNLLIPKVSALPFSIEFKTSDQNLYLTYYKDATDSLGGLKVLIITFIYERI